MSEIEQEHPSDDREIEIIDLDLLPAVQDSVPTQRSTSASTAVPTRLSLRSRLSPRQRGTRFIVTVGLIAITLLVIVGNSPATRTTALNLFVYATPAATLTSDANANQLYIEGIPPWGQLLLDGHAVTPFVNENGEQTLSIARGHHLLRLLAAPFQPLGCTISMPVNSADTCHRSRVDAQVANTWIITFYESLATLPTAQRIALVQAAQATLDTQQSTALVRPGERYVYLGTASLVNTAIQPLQATQHFHLLFPEHVDVSCLSIEASTNPACATQVRDCVLFCTMPFTPALPGVTNNWVVQAAFEDTFDYTTATNKVIASHQPDAMPSATTSALPDQVTLGITWNGEQWHVQIIGPAIPAGNPIACVAAENKASEELIPLAEAKLGSNTIFQFVASPVTADGCLLALFLLPNTNTAPSPYYFLYRFGIVLAVNNLAQRIWPQLPLADAYERNLAQAMSAHIFET